MTTLSSRSGTLLAVVVAVLAVLVSGCATTWPTAAGPTAGPSPAAAGHSSGAGSSAASGTCTVHNPSPPGAAESHLKVVALCALPPEAARTAALIQRGGPFPSHRDGITFGNRERILPAQPNGYYHEYTVPTPGSKDRGARRIVTGGPVSGQQALFYSGDHYASFVVVDASAR